MENVASQFLTVSEAAKVLRVQPLTIYRQVGAGKIPACKIGSRTLIPASFIESLACSAFAKAEGVENV